MGTGSNPSVKQSPKKGPLLVANFSNVLSTSRGDIDDTVTAESDVVPAACGTRQERAPPPGGCGWRPVSPWKTEVLGISTEQFPLPLSPLRRNQLGAYFTPPATAFTIIISPGSVTAAGGHFFCYKQ